MILAIIINHEYSFIKSKRIFLTPAPRTLRTAISLERFVRVNATIPKIPKNTITRLRVVATFAAFFNCNSDLYKEWNLVSIKLYSKPASGNNIFHLLCKTLIVLLMLGALNLADK